MWKLHLSLQEVLANLTPSCQKIRLSTQPTQWCLPWALGRRVYAFSVELPQFCLVCQLVLCLCLVWLLVVASVVSSVARIGILLAPPLFGCPCPWYTSVGHPSHVAPTTLQSSCSHLIFVMLILLSIK
ncbi:Serine/threonine-protein phosphatase [Zea mays]|jgi:hypothetical protein|uniref:Serine/threonine-protein phosphatase n=1 Tax=Zea mays TaxID=4577 RepID=A0A1D6KVN1_MAIZE|nr:Serine/threonine-protein phosphatase [Zea mays]ONM06570.1 Serine/threonine-protein phosphatase [Zea mays]